MNEIKNVLKSSLIEYGLTDENSDKIIDSLPLCEDSDEPVTEEDRQITLFAAKNLSSIVKKFGEKEASAFIPEHEMILPAKEESYGVYNGRFDGLADLPKWLRITLQVLLCFLLFAACALLFVTAAALSVVCIALMIALTVGGIVLFLAGFLYGISQMSVFKASALFEIGFSFIIGGIAVLLCVLIYNFLFRTIPFVTKKLFGMIKNVISDLRLFRKTMKNKEVGK